MCSSYDLFHLVNIQTHTQTHRQHFDQLVRAAQPAELKNTPTNTPVTATGVYPNMPIPLGKLTPGPKFTKIGDDLLPTQIYHSAKFHRPASTHAGDIRYKISADKQTNSKRHIPAMPIKKSSASCTKTRRQKSNSRSVVSSLRWERIDWWVMFACEWIEDRDQAFSVDWPQQCRDGTAILDARPSLRRAVPSAPGHDRRRRQVRER